MPLLLLLLTASSTAAVVSARKRHSPAILRPLGIVGAGAMRSFSAASMASIKELRRRCVVLQEGSGGERGGHAAIRNCEKGCCERQICVGRAATELAAVRAERPRQSSGHLRTDFVPRNGSGTATSLVHLYERVPPPPASGVHNVNVESLLSIPSQRVACRRFGGRRSRRSCGKIREKCSPPAGGSATRVVGSYVHGCVDMDRYPGLGSSAAVVVIGCDRKLASEGEMHLAPNEAVMKVLRPLAKKLAMHVVATKPKYVGAQDIPIEVIDSERNLLRQQALDAGKPPAIVDKVVEGRIQKYLGEVALLYQPHVVEVDSPPVSAVLNAASKDISALLKEKVKLTIDGFILCP